VATTRQRYKDEGADEIQTNSARHAGELQRIYLRTHQRLDFTTL
jgi:hypothetical protein